MTGHDSLRWQLLGAISSGVLLAGCGGSTGDDRAQMPAPVASDGGSKPSPQPTTTSDASTPPTPACSGRVEQGCYTREAMENMVRHGVGQIPLDPPRSDAEVAAAFLPNGCARAEFVADGCCNPALGEGTPMGDQCCYQHCTGACCGRPLLVAGVARVAPAAARSDWLAARVAAVAPVPHAEVAAQYLEDALLEHASVAAFARFTLELLAVGAPAAFVADAQRAALDEIEHARVCFALASRFGGGPVGPGRLELSGVELTSELPRLVEQVVREGCVGETIGAALLAEQSAAAGDPELSALLAEIAGDERRHAELAWRFVAWAIASGGADVRNAAERAFQAALAVDPPAAATQPPEQADWRRLGRLTAAERRALERDVRRHVLAPAFTALLAGTARPQPVSQASA